MKFYLELLSFGFLFASAMLWFKSAAVRLTAVGSGLDELNRVTELSSDLQRMGKWNFWAASTIGVATLLQIIVRYALNQ